MLTFASSMLFLALSLWLTSLFGKHRARRGAVRQKAPGDQIASPKDVWLRLTTYVLLCAAMIALVATLWTM